ncbi:uncharacterized protein LOC130904219 [Diorhabda carinulata]|uniref:uncharacterized protein LOC130904219 n=1 Tax=Diorhabda carinulata TaxID=1163345 RepID=UPI0025A29665|nr:uncharacterized protein LOC130904219 [Diorhabda carinulata]
MALRRALLVLHVLASFVHFSTARAVNISNAWVLPEEGFPVFYRYFRDRISWYEADAVCQFHHSYLVTADSTSQYDAIRAYLKELDITDTVWIGLSKNADKPNFTWTNSLQPLSGEGHWQEAIPPSKNSQCIATDSAKDFLWETLTCGGPDVASFICEMPIPSWAMGPKGCLLTELPSLTVLYIPEQSSLEMTSDCGLDGTKRIACKGNADREEILKQLTCAISNEDFEDKSTKSSILASTVSYTQSDNKITKIWTSNTIDVDYGIPTRHRRETEDTLSASSTDSTEKITTTQSFTVATNYDTEVTSNPIPAASTVISSTQTTTPISTTSAKTIAKTSTISSTSGTTEQITPIIEVEHTYTTVTASSESKMVKTTTENDEKDIVIEYPSAISQGQLFSIIENGTMFDIIELNDTKLFQQQTTSIAETKTSKPSTKLEQLDEKKTKNADSKGKVPTKKEIYKNSDPKKKNNQKIIEDKNDQIVVPNEERKKNETNLNVKRSALKTLEAIPDERTEDKKEELASKEELDLNKQVEIIPLKQTIQPEPKEDIETNLSKEDSIQTQINLDREMENKESMEEMDLNKEIEIFPLVNDKSPHLNRTFRKELPMMADEPPFEPINGENKLELMDIDEFAPENETKIDPNIYLLNKNITKNNESEIIEILKKQLLPKLLQKKNVSVEKDESTTTVPVIAVDEIGERPRPNRQRQLTRPHGRSFYPNFFSRVLG